MLRTAMHLPKILCAAALAVLAACSSNGPWRQTDPRRVMVKVSGRVEVLDMPQHGDVRLEVTPIPEDAFVLAPGQTRLICIIPARDRHDFEPQLLNTAVGQTVEIAGYWMAREEAGITRHYVYDTTDLVPPNGR
jgi:hypothetical protein